MSLAGEVLVMTALAFGVLCAFTPAPAGGEEVAIVARAPWSFQGVEKPRQWVVRGPEDLVGPGRKAAEPVPERERKARAERYARALKVKELDFRKHLLVAVAAGERPTGGYRVEIVRAEKHDAGKVVTVYWKLHKPGPDALVTQALTYPGAIALLERFPGRVEFKRLPEE